MQEEIARLARTLERLQAERAGQTAGSAAAKVGRQAAAGEKGDQPQPRTASRIRPTRTSKRPRQQLAERRKQVEADLARARWPGCKMRLKSLHERQQQAADRNRPARESACQEPERAVRAQTASVRDLAREQQALEGETRSLAEKLAGAEVFQLALTSAAQTWPGRPGTWIAATPVSQPQQAEQDALDRLEPLLDV